MTAMGHTPIFVGRQDEQRQFVDWLNREAPGLPRAAIVQGPAGIGKTSLLARFEAICEATTDIYVQRFNVNENESASEFFSRVLENTHYLFAGTFIPTLPDDRGRFRDFLKVTLSSIGPPGKALGELLGMLIRDQRQVGYERFIKFLCAIAAALKSHQRYVILIDPEKYLHLSQVAEWRSVAERIPERVRVVIAQRPDDVLAIDPSLRGVFDRLPRQHDLAELPINDLPAWYEAERQVGRLFLAYPNMTPAQAAALAKAAGQRYHGYPAAHDALMRLFAIEPPPDPLAALAQWPVKLAMLMDELFAALSCQGEDQLRAALTLQVFSLPTPRDLWGEAAELKPEKLSGLLADRRFTHFFRTDAANRYAPFHPLFAERLEHELRASPALMKARAEKVLGALSARFATTEQADDFALLAARPVADRLLDQSSLHSLLDRIIPIKFARGLYDSIEADAQAIIAGTSDGTRERSVAWNLLGDARLNRGDGPAALIAYREHFAIVERLAARDPANTEWQRDLSISHERIGDVLLPQGDGPAALTAYRAALAILERLAARDPANTQWQRDLSVSQEKIGNVLLAQGDGPAALTAYRASLTIRERLAARDPADAEWQRDLSVSHIKIGDVLLAQGDGPAALTAYRASLTIRERLAARDPANTEWQRDLYVSHSRIGNTARRAGQTTDARAHFQIGRAIMTRLVKLDQTNAQWKRDLVWLDAQLE